MKPPRKEPDIMFPAAANRISRCHFNPDSYYPYLLKQEHLESLITRFYRSLLHRCFGAATYRGWIDKQQRFHAQIRHPCYGPSA